MGFRMGLMDEAGYLESFPLSSGQTLAILARDCSRCIATGGNIPSPVPPMESRRKPCWHAYPSSECRGMLMVKMQPVPGTSRTVRVPMSASTL